MPDFEITLPNGTKLGGSAPEGTTQEQIMAEYEKQYSQHKKNFLDIFKGGLHKGLPGFITTFGGPEAMEETPEQRQSREAEIAGETQRIEQQYPTPQSLTGRAVQGVGEALTNPLTYLGGPTGLVGMAGRVISGITGSVGSELAGAATGDSFAGRLAGGIAGSLAPRGLVRAGGRIAGAVAPRPDALPPRVPPERAAPIATLRAAGVEPTAGDVLGSRFVRSLERNADRVYGESYQRLKTEVLETYTGAVANEMGETARRLTPEVFQRARERMGRVFQRTARVSQILADTPLGNTLSAIPIYMMRFNYSAEQIARVQGLINDINTGFITRTLRRGPRTGSDIGVMDGTTYQQKTSYASELSRVSRANSGLEGSISHFAEQIRSALDDALERTAHARGTRFGTGRRQAFLDLQEARRQWRNMLVLEKSITGPNEQPAQGLVQPERLGAALTSGGQDAKSAYARGQGRLVVLANAGTAVIEPYRPAGWERWATGHAVGVAMNLLAGGPLSKTMVASLAAPDIAGRLTNSRLVQNMLKNQRATSLLQQLEGARTIAARSAAQTTTTQPQGLVRPQALIGKRAKDYASAFGRGGLAEVGREMGFQVPETGVERLLHSETANTALGTVGGGAPKKTIELLNMLRKEGKTIREIASATGLSSYKIRNYFYKGTLPEDAPQKSNIIKRKPELPKSSPYNPESPNYDPYLVRQLKG